MDYELALKLKNAGFPQRAEDLINEVEFQGKKYTKPTEPTLEELIEACGEEFGSLTFQGGTCWVAVGWINGKPYQEEGSTPLEAVANLWLCINRGKV